MLYYVLYICLFHFCYKKTNKIVNNFNWFCVLDEEIGWQNTIINN